MESFFSHVTWKGFSCYEDPLINLYGMVIQLSFMSNNVTFISKQSLLKLTESEKKELSYFLSLCFHKEVYFKTTKVREISSDKSVVNMNMHFRNYFNLSISTHWRQRKKFNEKSLLCPTFLGWVHCIIVKFWGKKTRLKYFSLCCTVVESLCSFNWVFFCKDWMNLGSKTQECCKIFDVAN